MKKLIALLLVFVMVLTMVACAAKTNAPKTDAPATDESKTEAPADKIKVGFVTQSLTNASQAYAWTQFQKYAPEYGFEVTLFDEDYYFYSRPCGRGDQKPEVRTIRRYISTHAPAGGATAIKAAVPAATSLPFLLTPLREGRHEE